jgi:hypothetical protein
MNFHMNDMEKTMAELHGMLKIAEDSIKKNPNHIMMIQKEKKKRKHWMPSKAKVRKRFSMSPRALSLRQKVNLTLLLMRNASTVTKRYIDLGTIRRTWSSKRRRREVRLPLQV